jgi:hypothetical protein
LRKNTSAFSDKANPLRSNCNSPGKEGIIGLFVKVGTTQELDALEAGKLVEAAGQRIAIFNLGGKY